MNTMTEPKYPCTDCDMRKIYAILFDFHISGEDCPYKCEKWERYKAEKEK